ncbi:SNF2-related protein [Marinobacter flavimaris]|uniref:DEAD/DEAH box helicase n=1 Tax=Marinobacter flavimaris TaxID=262076 RepID=UPI003866EC9D
MLISHTHLTQIYGETVVQRGRQYFNEGRVDAFSSQFEGMSIRLLTGTVAGSERRPYQTRVWIDPHYPFDLRTQCSCPVQFFCKHSVAVLLAANFRLEAESQNHLQNVRAQEQTKRWFAKVRDRTDKANVASSECLVYVLKPPRAFEALSVSVRKARPRKDGSLGRGNPCSPWHRAQLDYERPKYLRKSDIAPLTWISAFSSGYYSEPKIEDYTGASFLDAVIETGRLFWESTENPPLTRGGPLRATFEWMALPNNHWQLALSSLPDSIVLAPTDPPWYIDTLNHSAGIVNTGTDTATFELLMTCPPLTNAHIEELLPELTPLMQELAIPLPEDLVLPEIITTTPKPVLQLYSTVLPGHQELKAARLAFIYGDHRIHYTDKGETVRLESSQGPVLIIRDEEAELELAGNLDQFIYISIHARDWQDPPPAHSLMDFTLPSQRDWLSFLAYELPMLEASGWLIEVDESFDLAVIEPDQWYGLTQQTDEPGWFDVELGIEYEGRTINLIPLLSSALERLKRESEYDTEGALILPEHLWLHDDERLIRVHSDRVRPMIETLFTLYGKPDVEGRLRLSRLDSAQLLGRTRAEWENSEELEALGKRLTGFTGLEQIRPAQELNAQLRPYQQTGLNWLQFLGHNGLGGVLADDMGLGKTLQTLASVQVEKAAGRLKRPALIVCPTSVIQNWQGETRKFTPELRVLTLHGANRKSLFAQIEEKDLIITSYPLLTRDIEQHKANLYSQIFFDEAQNLKNHQTAVARAARKLRANNRFALTGTPMENHLGELWALFDLVLPGYLGSHDEFRQNFRKPIEEHGAIEQQALLTRRVKPFLLRRTKEQVTPELPEKTEIIKPVELNRAQRDLYETVRASMDKRIRKLMADKGAARSQIEILDALLKLRQICCHPRLLTHSTEGQSAKLDYLMEMLAELIDEGRRIIVFSQFTSMLALIEDELNKRGTSYAKLTGQTKNRKKPVEEFQRGEKPLFLISLKAGGTGLNLTAADCVIHYDPWWNPAVENQATDRAWRIGQDKPVFVYRLICEGTVEEKIQNLQQRKSQLANSLYGNKEALSTALTSDEIATLFEKM